MLYLHVGSVLERDLVVVVEVPAWLLMDPAWLLNLYLDVEGLELGVVVMLGNLIGNEA